MNSTVNFWVKLQALETIEVLQEPLHKKIHINTYLYVYLQIEQSTAELLTRSS